jgi:hypothetical protein
MFDPTMNALIDAGSADKRSAREQRRDYIRMMMKLPPSDEGIETLCKYVEDQISWARFKTVGIMLVIAFLLGPFLFR